jgi:choline dehydrogenase-like flavoprotein
MSFLTPAQKTTLAAICDTFFPTLEPQPDESPAIMQASARDLALVDALETSLERVMDTPLRAQLQIWLGMIEQGAFNGVSAGVWRGFSTATLAERERVLRAWALSTLPQARMTFQGLKRLALFLSYTLTPNDQPNPTWGAMRYAGGVPPGERTPRPIQPLAIHAPTTLTTDVLIIGSGAGGGVVAGELACAGHDVIVVEKGGYYTEADFNGRELPATEGMYEKYGALTTRDLSMIILAGSLLGGGTTINWSASLRTPLNVLEEWARDYGFSAAAAPEFQSSMDAICERTNVGLSEHNMNGVNDALARGCKALGYDVQPVPRNVKGCEDCGFCNFGCAFGAKQGTLKTYLQDAHDRGGRIVVRAHVQRITHEAGVATGAIMQVTDGDRRTHEVTVKAKVVVAACGSIQTPPLLLRSGLHNPNIGAHLHLHPVTMSYGLFADPLKGWVGIPLSTVSRQFADQDGRGYGAILETAPTHPGIAALVLPWVNGRQHKRLMAKIAHLANIIVITRDRGEGRVSIDKQGQPVVDYALTPSDAAHMMTGLKAALRAHLAAGAHEVCAAHSDHDPFVVGANGGFEAHLRRVEARGFRPNAYALLSAHQMSSCRIAGDARAGVCDPTGQSYELRNLYVADASAMPTATGVNPMISIMTTAHYIAQQIKARL